MSNKTPLNKAGYHGAVGMGRPKGSRNKLTILKLAAETAIRENNIDRMLDVCNLIIDQALDGDKSSQKLVWNSMVSNGAMEEKNAVEKVTISINATETPQPTKDANASNIIEGELDE